MSKEWIVALTLCAVIFHVVLAGRAFARASAGLVLEQSGSINPAMAPYSEIPAAATITLSTGAKIVFLYYRSCMQVTVLGGQIQFRPNGYSVINGIQSHERVPCPRALDVKGAGEVSGINLRGAEQNPTISPTPSFVLVGKRSFDFTAIKLSKDDKEVYTGELVNNHCAWRKAAQALESGANLELLLIPKTADQKPIKLNFTVATPSWRSDEALVLIRVD